MLSLEELLDALVAATFAPGDAGEPRHAVLRRAAQRATVDGLVRLSADATASADVRAVVDQALAALAARLHEKSSGAHAAFLAREIERWLERPHAGAARIAAAPEPPPGSPIGSPIGSGLPPGWSACSQD
jgi:hypothetical protein